MTFFAFFSKKIIPLVFHTIFIKMTNFLLMLVEHENVKYPGPEVIKKSSCSTQLSMKFKLLIKTKIPTNKEVSCFKSLRCCIYHANKC